MGVIADLHHGLEPRAMERLETFIGDVESREPDCILQLGDFNFGTRQSDECMRLWRQYEGERHHVLGNHDMDFVTKEEIVEFWAMPGPYYSFDAGGYHFVVLDRNVLRTPDGYIHYGRGNFYVDPIMRAHADPEQLEWLADDLSTTGLPTVIFSHQGLGMDDGDGQEAGARKSIETVLEGANRDGAKIIACFCGHHHLDRYARKQGIHYVWLNSASYYWVGDAYGRMAPYRDSLYTFVTFHPDGLIEVEGRTTAWDSPTPLERGYPGAAELTPYISARQITY
jgi:3',5'-cyclic AMP phosphodiesterase CpdA